MGRRTHKQLTQEKKSLLYVRKVTTPFDELSKDLLKLKNELINNKKGSR